MKKIYMILAAITLLSMSLNAQLLPAYNATGKHDVYLDKGKPGSTAGLFRAPAKINTADGEFLVGPYTTDDFSSTGKGLYSTTGSGRVEVSTRIPRADIAQYLGQEIVGYRFATVGGTVSCYSFLVEGEGPNSWVDDLFYWNIQSDGTYYDLSGTQWHEFYLDAPVVFQIPDTTAYVWFGYKYFQESSNNGNYTMTPIAVNPNVTSYDCYAYSYSNESFYDVTSALGGAVAAQLIFKAPSTDPVITALPTSVSMNSIPGATATEAVAVTGANLTEGITATISGTDAALFSVTPASLGTSGGSLTITYAPTATGTHTATLTLSSTGAQDVVITLNGTCSSDLTIFNGTDQNEYLPIYGYYYDNKQVNQMIYPASALTSIVGKDITSMTFYSPNIYFSNGRYTVKVGETTQTAFSSMVRNTTDLTATVVTNQAATSGGTELTITFDEPFNYHGGNLLVDFEVTTTGSYGGHTYFYGVNQNTNTGFNTHGSSSASTNANGVYTGSYSGLRQFLPKVTFTVEESLPKTDAPVITADTTATYVTITATAADPTAAVTLTIDGQTYTGTGSVSHNVPRGNTDTSAAVSATAQEDGKAVSDPATDNIGIPALPKTATPTINVVTNSDGSKTISAEGNGTVHLYVNGVEVTNPYTIPASTDGDKTYTVTATAQEDGKQISDTATETVTVAEAGRSPMPTISFVNNGDGTYTVTVTGTGEVAVYINDAEHGGTAGEPVATGQGSVSFIVEEHSVAMTLPLQATNQEGDLLVSHTAEATYTIPAMTIDNTFHQLDPQPANASSPVDLSKLMFVDRFSVVIPYENDHPRLYDYYLQETQVRQRTSNSVEVPVKHTGSDGLGFYSLNQIDNDLERKLVMNVRNAAMDIPLEADPTVYYYTESRGTKAYPDQADRKWLGVLQHTTDGTYSETLNPSYDYEEVYPGGQHHIHLDLDTITGNYNDYLTYVPIVWTYGFDRVLYPTDKTHNSYGAPKWKTGVGDVNVNAVDAERQINSASTTWNDNGKTSMYMLTVNATGLMPTVNTMPYEPYMFRVFVESQNGKLRGWKYVEADSATHTGSHYAADEGSTTGPICVWSEYVKNSPYITRNGNEVYFVKTKVEERDSTTGAWIIPREMNIMFAALDDMTTTGSGDNERIIPEDLKIYVRFYYIVEGSADGHVPHPGVMMRDGDAPAGYGSESPGDAPSPSTGVKEVRYYGDVVSTTYYNVQGMSASTPFEGINIVVERYSNGTTRTYKVVVR